jgi:ribosomal protein S18 acetylase RimI-like enzyme
MNSHLQMRPSSADMTLRPMHAGDLPAMSRLVQQMSWPHRPEDCASLLELGAGIAAVDATDVMIGVGMRWSFGQRLGTIGAVMVAREWQGRGIGRRLMTSLIAGSGPRAIMLNATAEGLGLYEKLGFIRTGLVRQHQARLADGAALPPAPVVPLRRAVPSDHAAIHGLEATVFGADRSALVGRLLAAGDAWVVDRTGRPAGFAILRAFGRGTMIGPVVAASEDEAIALVAVAAKAAPAGILRVDIPAHAERLAEWLTAAGLPAIDTVTTMVSGDWPAAPTEPRRFGLALQALG